MEKYQKQYMTITNILLSLNSTIINEVLQKYYIIKCLIKYNIQKIFDILNEELKISMFNGGFKSLKDMKFNRIEINEKA